MAIEQQRREGRSDVVDAATHPERFDPEQSASTLMDSEHRGRYWWGSQLIGGKVVLDAGCGTGYGLAILAEAGAAEVTGIDVDADAVAEARRSALSHGANVFQGDLCALELPDDSFDAAVCFETIEHLESPEQGLAELRRVVRPGGILLVSSPNPDVYPSGNEHHRHELRPADLRRLVQEHFENVQVYFQCAWLASVIEPAEANGNGNGQAGPRERGLDVRRTGAQPSGPTFGIVVGCDAQPPEQPSLISLGDPFEVRWWEEQVSAANQRAEQGAVNGVDSIQSAARDSLEAAQREAEARLREAEERLREAEERAAEVEQRSARAEAQNAALAERLEETSKSLVDANQELAQTPVLKHRLAEMYEQKAGLEAKVQEVLNSRSWQITGFLRKISHALKLQR